MEGIATFEFKPDIVSQLPGCDHLTHLVEVVTGRHSEDELFFKGEIVIGGVELSVILAKEGHAWGLRGGLFAQLELELWWDLGLRICGTCGAVGVWGWIVGATEPKSRLNWGLRLCGGCAVDGDERRLFDVVHDNHIVVHS